MRQLTALLVGCGRMGQHHARVMRNDADLGALYFVDSHPDRARALADRHAGRVGSPAHADLVVIAASTPAHASVATAWLARGARVLVEKPLAATIEQAREVASADCFVGHCERFNPGVRAAKLRSLKRVVGHRVVPRRAGDDVVTDLLVHDIDLLQALVPGLHCVHATGDPHTQVTSTWKGDGFEGVLTAGREGEPRRSWKGEDDESVFIDFHQGLAWRSDAPCIPDGDLDALQAQWKAFRRGTGLATAADGLQALVLAHDVLNRLGGPS